MDNEKIISKKASFKKNFTLGVVVMIALLAVLNIQMVGLTRNMNELSDSLTGLAVGEQPTAPVQQEPPVQDAPPVVDTDARELIGDSPTLGDPDAPVVIIEWSDFVCGYCRDFWSETLPLLKENYIDTGDVLFVYKPFLAVGGDSEAEASLCADEQGAFWEFHDLIFRNFKEYTDDDLFEWAEDLGMDVEEFRDCYESGRMANIVDADAQQAMSVGIQGTPGFLVDKVVISGAQPYENFVQVIEDALRN